MGHDKDKTDGAGFERRQDRRHAVERPCRVSSGVLHPDAVPGLTMNVSRAGMLVKFPDSGISALLPRVGSQAQITIDLPPSAGYPPRSLECTGRVVREVDAPEETPVLAFEIHRMLVRDRDARRDTKTRRRDRLVH
jgi:hypothetical protein